MECDTRAVSPAHVCPQPAVPAREIALSEYQASSAQAGVRNFADVDLNAPMHYKVPRVTPGCIHLYHGLG